jgi:hypothetical protein
MFPIVPLMFPIVSTCRRRSPKPTRSTSRRACDIPVLMLNGRFDFFFPTESSQEPMFTLLGTSADRKRRVVYDTSHTIPRTELIREMVTWLDPYLGPVR